MIPVKVNLKLSFESDKRMKNYFWMAGSFVRYISSCAWIAFCTRKTVLHQFSCSNRRFVYHSALTLFSAAIVFIQHDAVDDDKGEEEEEDHSQQFGIGMSRDIDHYRLLLECLMCQIDFGRAERIEERVCLLTNNTDWSKYIGLSLCGYTNTHTHTLCFLYFEIWSTHHPIFCACLVSFSVWYHSLTHSLALFLRFSRSLFLFSLFFPSSLFAFEMRARFLHLTHGREKTVLLCIHITHTHKYIFLAKPMAMTLTQEDKHATMVCWTNCIWWNNGNASIAH